jgi:hypothetical protein
LDVIGAAVLLAFVSWISNPVLNSKALGFGSGVLLLIVGFSILGFKAGRRPKLRVKGVESYWGGMKWRPKPVPKERRFQFWVNNGLMLAIGIGFGLSFVFGFLTITNDGLVTYLIFPVAIEVLLIGVPAWFMGNEIISMGRTRSEMIKTLTSRKDSCLSVLTEAYSALEYIGGQSLQAKMAIVGTVRGQFRALAQGETSPEGKVLEPLVWDDDIRKKVEALFPVIAEDLNDSDMVASYAEALTPLFLKSDAQTLKAMKERLTGPFDKAYPKFTYNSGSSQFIFDCLAGLHEYDASAMFGYFSDAIVGSQQMFQALVRSLSTDLLTKLRARGVVPLLKIKLARRISEYETSKNQEALDRAKWLEALL